MADHAELLDDVEVEWWRCEQLKLAGYPPRYAKWLARNPAVDLHYACDLLQAGCPLETALDILT